MIGMDLSTPQYVSPLFHTTDFNFVWKYLHCHNTGIFFIEKLIDL